MDVIISKEEYDHLKACEEALEKKCEESIVIYYGNYFTKKYAISSKDAIVGELTFSNKMLNDMYVQIFKEKGELSQKLFRLSRVPNWIVKLFN